jgi:hypothetical protein
MCIIKHSAPRFLADMTAIQNPKVTNNLASLPDVELSRSFVKCWCHPGYLELFLSVIDQCD